MFIINLGINYKTAPLEIREKMMFPQKDLPAALQKLKAKQMVEGCVILSTCNRSEVYVAAVDAEEGLTNVKEFLAESCGFTPREIDDYFYVYTVYDAIRHLFRVVAGLDSMVLGESQILGQVKDAYQTAVDCGVTNSVLNMFFQQALAVGKKVRTETDIDRHAVSISSVAVEKAWQSLGELNGKKIIVIGAGEMSELTLQYMVANGVSDVTVVNRSYNKGVDLARKFQGRAVEYGKLYQELAEADIVISATAASGYIIKADQVKDHLSAGNDHPIFMIDIAVPRDIEPAVGNIPGVTLYDIDDLRNVVDLNLEERRQAAVKATALIEDEIESFLKWLSSRFVVPTIVAFKEKIENVKNTELEKALNRLGPLTERELKVIQTLANSIVKQIMHKPMVNLKKYAATNRGHLYTKVFENLFDLKKTTC